MKLLLGLICRKSISELPLETKLLFTNGNLGSEDTTYIVGVASIHSWKCEGVQYFHLAKNFHFRNPTFQFSAVPIISKGPCISVSDCSMQVCRVVLKVPVLLPQTDGDDRVGYQKFQKTCPTVVYFIV